MQRSADEKWLVVLTDGDEFYRNGTGLGKGSATVKALEEDLSACAAKMNVMYLGMGSQSAMPEKVTHDYIYYAKKTATSQEVLATLSDMCNLIFGRDRLQVVNNKISFDIPMKKLFVFVQGEGIKNVKLGSLKASSAVDIKHSTLGGGGSYKTKFLVDTSLQGVLAVYENVDPAELAISFDGKASSVDCFYEPDVDLMLQLQDETGEPVDLGGEPSIGTYLLDYSLVDKNGNKTTSELLGKTAYTLTYYINGEKFEATSDTAQAVPVELGPNDTLDAKVKVTYLSGYTLEKKASDYGWPEGGLTFVPPPAGYLEAKIKGLQEEYDLSALKDGQKVGVDFIYEGAALTGDQLDGMTEVKATLKGGNATCTIERDDEGYYIMLKPYEVCYQTECTDYTLQVSGVYINENGLNTNKAVDTKEFEINDDSRALKMTVNAQQSYVQVSKVDQAKPIVMKFSYSGDPLTAEELNALKLNIDSDGLDLITEVDEENSCIYARINPESSVKPGKYKIKVTATGENEVGEPQECTDTTKITTGKLPGWFRSILPFLILLLLLLLIFLYLNMKVLPRNVGLKNVEFRVDGTKIQGGTARIMSPGKKKSEIVIDSPKYGLDPGAPQRITMQVTALNNRLTPSSKRRYTVNSVKINNPSQVQRWELKGAAYKADSSKPGAFKSVANGGPFKEVQAGPSTPFYIKADTRKGSSVAFRGTLISK
jgi:hypothetical protein